MLVQHFVNLAGARPLPVPHLDALTPALLAMTSEVPFYAATVARARLAKLHERLAAATTLPGTNSMPSNTSANGSSSAAAKGKQQLVSPWPGARAIAQLKLFTTLFPTSDRRHPVVTPAALLVGKYLAGAGVAGRAGEVQSGLLLTGLALHMAAAGGRFAPEPFGFLTDVLAAALPAPAPGSAEEKAAARRERDGAPPRVARGLLAPAARGAALATLTPRPPTLVGALEACGWAEPSSAGQQGAGNGDSGAAAEQFGDEQKLGLVGVALASLTRAVALLVGGAQGGGGGGSTAHLGDDGREVLEPGVLPGSGGVKGAVAVAPELLPPVAAVLRALGPTGPLGGPLPPPLEAQRTQLLATIRDACSKVVGARRPLVQAHRLRAHVAREYNPRFEEEGYTAGRDYDPDRARAEERQFKRKMVKEKRGGCVLGAVLGFGGMCVLGGAGDLFDEEKRGECRVVAGAFRGGTVGLVVLVLACCAAAAAGVVVLLGCWCSSGVESIVWLVLVLACWGCGRVWGWSLNVCRSWLIKLS